MLTNNTILDLVLLIDDSTIDNFVNEKIIKNNSFAKETIAFTNAGDALVYLSDIDEQQLNEKNTPSLIFLDLDMPLINGFRFLELYNKLSPFIKSRCKITILTTSINPHDKSQALSDKNTIAFYSKPLISKNLDELKHLLRKN